MTNVFPFPLFHGTSTVFLESIRQNGLGGFDPVATLHGVECLRQLRSLAVCHLTNTDWWSLNRPIIEAMANQQVSMAGFNWRHGASYLTPSERSAARYALSNACGSELLSTCLELYTHLKKLSVADLSHIEARFPDLFALSATDAKRPLLVRADRVPIRAVVSERGDNADATIALIESCLAQSVPALLQQLNFQLIGSLPSDQLTFSVITRTGGSQEFPTYILHSLQERAT